MLKQTLINPWKNQEIKVKNISYEIEQKKIIKIRKLQGQSRRYAQTHFNQ